MALVTQPLANIAGGAVIFTLEYDDALMRGTKLIVDNTSGQPCYGSVRTPTGQRHEGTFGPGHTEIAIPTTGANRVDVVWWQGIPGSRLMGFDWFTRFPA